MFEISRKEIMIVSKIKSIIKAILKKVRNRYKRFLMPYSPPLLNIQLRPKDLLLRYIRRWRLQALYKDYQVEKENITIVIAIRNIRYESLINALRYLKKQDYDPSLIEINIVDYGSNQEFAQKLRELSDEFRASYIRVNTDSPWNIAHAVNIGIKKSKTKYVLYTGADVLLQNNFIRTSIEALKKDPYQFVLTRMHYLPELSEEELHTLSFDKLKQKATHTTKSLCKAVSVVNKKYHELIRGFDESYVLFGPEDRDYIQRLILLGLKLKDISATSSILHQWHGRSFHKNDYVKSVFDKHSQYCKDNFTIKRNQQGWGELP